MPGLGTLLVIAVVGGIGVVAVADSLVQEDERVSIEVDPDPRLSADALRTAGVTGVLLFSDPHDECRVHAIRLPELGAVPPPKLRSCSLLYARPERPDIVPSRRDLFRAFRGFRFADYAESFALEEIARLGGSGSAAIVRVASFDVLAVFRQRELVAAPRLYEALSDLRVSPKGSYVAAYAGGFQAGKRGVVALGRDGRREPLPVRGRAIAWSPDERWTALATGASVYVFRTGQRSPRLIRLPLVAAGLAWR